MSPQVAVLVVLLASLDAFAQTALPPKMEGTFRNPTYGTSGGTRVELVKMESPERASVRVTMSDVYYHGTPCVVKPVETVAEKANGGWKFAVRVPDCLTYTITIAPVPGKQRFEGTYTTDFPSEGVIFYEW
jgi:hypothetical protein